MRMRLFLFYAFPREVADVMRAMGPAERAKDLPFRAFHLRHLSHFLTAVETGLGMDNAVGVFNRLLQSGTPPDAVVSAGYCGALTRQTSVGDVILASNVCLLEGQEIERLSLPDQRMVLERLSSRLPVRAGTIITVKEWIKKGDIARFTDPDMPLPVCDMETFGLAQVCSLNKLPLFALRAVSDGADRDLSFDPWDVCDKSGTYKASRALKLFLTRPHLLIHLNGLYRGSKIASRTLGQAVNALLQVL